MSKISVGVLSKRLLTSGVPADQIRPWHTGGGCLTLFVGPEGGRSIAVGPGTSFDPFGSDGYFSTADLYVCDADEDGEVPGGVNAQVPPGANADSLVALIVGHAMRIGVIK